VIQDHFQKKSYINKLCQKNYYKKLLNNTSLNIAKYSFLLVIRVILIE